LLESIAAGARVDAVVVALIGERGREAEAWLHRIDRRTTIVCATADRSAGERVRAAEIAMAQACFVRERGLHALLIFDSLARYAAALRERAVALGEPVGGGGYPPTVWAEMSRFLESAGNCERGSVTVLATILVDGDEERDPVCVNARAALDGHVALSPSLARAGRFPAIDVLASTSRLLGAVVDEGHRADAATVRLALARIAASEDLRLAGMGARDDPELARLAETERALDAFLRQSEPQPAAATRAALRDLAAMM
jgi:type III secretion protein N (ATPase)